MNCFDLIVIGAGPGGYEVAAHQSAHGKKVVIIEKDRLGGTCLNRGCIPTKCLCATAKMIDNINHSSEFGVDVSSFSASYPKAHSRMEEIVDRLREGVTAQLGKCQIVNGKATILPDGGVKVDNDVFYAPQVIIATGARPASLPGLENIPTSDDFLAAETLPESIVIIGGGVIGLEFAYIASSFSNVTVLEYCKEILPPFDAEIAKRLRLLLSEKGITFVTQAKVAEIRKEKGSNIVSYIDKKDQLQTVTATAVYSAVGRRAVLPEGLAEAGIEVDTRGFIVTDDNMQTTRDGFYAVGDCNGRMMLAHAATAQAMSVVGVPKNLDVVPSAVFTEPEIAMVGLTTEQCKARGLDYSVRKSLYRANGKALASGHPEGLVKIIYEPDTEKILGCHIIGAHASDLIQEATLSIANGLTLEQMSVRTIHGHPTLSELLASNN